MKIVILILGFALGVIAGVMFKSDSNLVLSILLLILGVGSVGYTVYNFNKIEEEYKDIGSELQDTQQALSKCMEDKGDIHVKMDGGSLD